MWLRRLDHNLLLAIALAAVVIVPRSILISRAHSECTDDEYHLVRGIRFWTWSLKKTPLNDPPVGEFISAVPLIVGRTSGDSPSVLYGQKTSPELRLQWIAIWKSILFLPFVAVAFVWVRRIYNVLAAWVATAILIVEPNFAAHIPVGAIDILGVEGIFIACFFAWRYFEKPTLLRLTGLAASVALALLLKHTAIILPVILFIFALLWWRRIHWNVVLVVPLVLLAIWAMMRFEYANPLPQYWPKSGQAFAETFRATKLPAVTYIRSFFTAMGHSERGHSSYLLGETRTTGWWYYFFVAAAYKVPLAIFALGLMALLSLKLAPPRWDEWGLLIPAVAMTAMLMTSDINIGFRHFLPAYVFLLMLASRVMLVRDIRWQFGAWVLLLVTTVDAARYHPDYLSYFNFPWKKPYLAINDSNVDWGQALPEVRRCLDEHPMHRKTIYLRYFGRSNVAYYIGDRAIVLATENNPPRTGILIISPVWEAGVYDPDDKYRALRNAKPQAVIGHCMLVYDLDQVKGWRASLQK